jgi:hypothetical protein
MSDSTDHRFGLGYDIPDSTAATHQTQRQMRLAGGAIVTENGTLASDDFSAGTAGWEIKGDGSVEFNDGTFRGDIVANTFATDVPNNRRIDIKTGDAGLIEFWQTGQTTNPGTIQATTAAGNPAMLIQTGGQSIQLAPTTGEISLTASADVLFTASTVTVTAGVLNVPQDLEMPGATNQQFHEQTWHTPSLGNSWVNYGGSDQTVRYKMTGGQCEIQGLIANGTVGAAAFTLPAIYRPAATLVFATDTISGHGRFDVLASGDVLTQSGGNGYFSINCAFTPGA